MLCEQDRHPIHDLPGAAAALAASLQDRRGSWYVVYTKPRQESVAEFNLQRQDFETYLPLFKVIKKPAQQHGKPRAAQVDRQAQLATEAPTAYEPMFPRYLFFKPASQRQSIAAARSSRGVHGLVAFGTELALVAPTVVQTIRELEVQRNDADIASISPFRPGRRVRLRDTALDGMEGVVHAIGAKRIVLLMNILGRQKTLNVTHNQVELV